MLTGSLFSTVFGTKLPGEGAIYLSQSLEFTAPVYFGDTVTATVTLVEKLEKGRVRFDCEASKADGTVVATGQALLRAPRPPAA